MNASTPLHEAAGHHQYQCVETLLRHRAPINQSDGRFNTPLHRASQQGHWTIVRLLLSFRADVTRRNCDGYNSFELAVLNNHPLTVQEFLRDRTWTDSLRNAQQRSVDAEELSTPFRKLIRSMPREAKEVLNRCIQKSGSADDASSKIVYHYEFLEDQLAMWRWKDSPSVRLRSSEPIDALGRNHPLYLLIRYHQYDLLKHPLINQLVRRKWLQFSRTFFWILFLFYGIRSLSPQWNFPSCRFLLGLVHLDCPPRSSSSVLLLVIQCFSLQRQLRDDLSQSPSARIVSSDEEELLRYTDQVASLSDDLHSYPQEPPSHLHSSEDVLRLVQSLGTDRPDSQRDLLARFLLLANVHSLPMFLPVAMRSSGHSDRLDHPE